jgi:uncharacterized protein YfdQ (DUF2303 family)
MEQKNDAAAVIETVKDLSKVELIDLPVIDAQKGIRLIALPAGKELHSLKDYYNEFREAPDRREGTATMTTLDSFIAHVNRHKNEDSVIFMDDRDPKQVRLIGVIDYNRQGADGAARFGRHRAVYSFPMSDEWNAWNDISRRELAQSEFATFIEDRIADVRAPADAGASVRKFAEELHIELATPARLVEMSRKLALHMETRVMQATNTSTGEFAIQYEEQLTSNEPGGARASVPAGFFICIPMFRGGAGYPMPVRLRVAKSGGAIKFRIALYRADLALEDGLKLAMDKVKTDTKLPVFRGAPETL